jgi:hypothetical protein
MAASPHRTHTQTLPHRVRTGRTDTGATLQWGKMAPMGRTQQSCPPTRSCMGSKTRTLALTERGAQLVLSPAHGEWGYTTTKSSGAMSMMDMAESDEDSGLPSVAEREPGPTMHPPPLSHLWHYAVPPSHSLFMFIIGICSLSFMLMIVSRPRSHWFSPFPSFSPTASTTHGLPRCIRLVSIYGRNDRLPLILPRSPSSLLIYLFIAFFWHRISSGFPFLFVVVFTPSHNRTVLYLLQARWHA